MLHQILLGIGISGLAFWLTKKFELLTDKLNLNKFINVGIILPILAEAIILNFCWHKYLNYILGCSLSCAAIIAIVGGRADSGKISTKHKMLVQFGASCLAVILVLFANERGIMWPTLKQIIIILVAIIGIVCSTNLISVVGIVDGLVELAVIFLLGSGGMLLISCRILLGNLLLFLAMIVFGFFCGHLTLGRLSLGKVGTYFVGFLIGIITFISYYLYNIPWSFWLIIYSVICFDAIITLFHSLFLRIASKTQHLTGCLPNTYQLYRQLQKVGLTHKDILYAVTVLHSVIMMIGFIAYYLNILYIAVYVVFILLGIIHLLIATQSKRLNSANKRA